MVAYDDSDSEAESEPAGSMDAAGQVRDSCETVKPCGQDFASGVLDGTGGALPPEPDSREDPAGQRLPLARLWRSEPGSCPSRRLQWPRTEPEATFPTSEPPRPSPWTSHAPAGHVPWAAARVQQVKLSCGTYAPAEPPLCAHPKSETPGRSGSSLQKKKREDCIVPYTPKRLRHSQASSRETGKNKDAEARDPSLRTPQPLCVAPDVSEYIQPYLGTPYKETQISQKVLFYLRGHKGPVSSIQWCPVFSKSHLFLSASLDKTFKVRCGWNRSFGYSQDRGAGQCYSARQ